jgi:acetoin utilization deacetylase AcuC-like enzyme
MHESLSMIPVFFRPEMVVPDAVSYSPSAGKPAAAVSDWQRRKLPVEIRTFEPVDEATLCLAHDPHYVRGVLEGRLANGFNNRLPSVAASLPFTTGAMLAAAREALANGRIACAPVSGFHHAGHAYGGGFCTFNGLMVAAMALKAAGRVQRVAILDLDQHWGDGTHDIVQHLGLRWIEHSSPSRDPEGPRHAARYLRRLASIVSGMRDCDLLLYQAGADAHVDDPLGGWMTSAQLAERDRIVFETAATFGLPVAWNLAGGYQRDADGGIEPVLAIHRATVEACAGVYIAAPCSSGDAS